MAKKTKTTTRSIMLSVFLKKQTKLKRFIKFYNQLVLSLKSSLGLKPPQPKPQFQPLQDNETMSTS